MTANSAPQTSQVTEPTVALSTARHQLARAQGFALGPFWPVVTGYPVHVVMVFARVRPCKLCTCTME